MTKCQHVQMQEQSEPSMFQSIPPSRHQTNDVRRVWTECWCRVLTKIVHLLFCQFSNSSNNHGSYFRGFPDTNEPLSFGHPYDHIINPFKKIDGNNLLLGWSMTIVISIKRMGGWQVIPSSGLVTSCEVHVARAPTLPLHYASNRCSEGWIY